MKHLHSLKKIQHHGFTLMEVMVSVTIFTIIITIGIGSLLTVNKTLQKTRAQRQTIDSFSYVVDTMTRRLRTGTNYTSNSLESITFNEQDNEDELGNGTGSVVTFRRTEVVEGKGVIEMIVNDGVPITLTPPEINVTDFTVSLYNSGQPMVQLSLRGEITDREQDTIIALQTIVSQRPFEPTVPSPTP